MPFFTPNNHYSGFARTFVGSSCKGYDVFVTVPSARGEIRCEVCGEVCDVKRNQYGPTGAIPAMAGLAFHHDLHTCPNRGKPWHVKALALVLARDETPSDELKALIQRDIDRALADRTSDQTEHST